VATEQVVTVRTNPTNEGIGMKRMKRLGVIVTLGALSTGLLGLTATGAQAATSYSNGFETDTSGWNNNGGTIVREATGYDNGGYADDIASASGGFHARLKLSTSASCAPGLAGSACTGPFTQWGGYETVFPTGGYKTEAAIYLDTAFALDHADYRFDWDSAINNSSGTFLQDYVFNAGTTATGFIIGTSTNAGRGSTFPANPCPSPSTAPNACRVPVAITTSGWYTFQHTFTEVGGFLDVQFRILDASGVLVPGADWTIKTGHAMANVGGHRYGWFVNQEIQDLAIDNTLLRGLALSADLSASKTDTPDPAHVGQPLTYTIPVTNNGPDSATGVTLTDALPKNTGNGSVTTTKGTCTISKKMVVACSLGTLASGETATVTITIKPTKKGTITNTVSVSATSPTDPNMANNTATQSTTVLP
jgi:uncharacterized repeat protein (TIGR01451 family)